MTTKQLDIIHLDLDKFTRNLTSRVDKRNDTSGPEKKQFFISKLEDLVPHIKSFSNTFIPDFFSIYFIEQGKFEKVNQLDIMVIKDREIYFSTPGEMKSWRLAEDAKGFFVAFTKEYLLTLIDNKNFLNTFGYLLPNARKKFELDASLHEFFERVFEEMLEERLSPNKHSQTSIKLWLSVLLIKINRIYTQENDDEQTISFTKASDFIYHKFMMAVEENFTQLAKGECHKPYTVTQFASQLNINASYLNECVKKGSGKTAKSLISERWLLLAKCQLMHTNKNISEIAYHLGFESPGYFARFFRKFEGMTPLHFRKLFSIR